MLDYLQYSFFVKALVAMALISLCAAPVGTYILTRRLSAIAGGITHACFGGLGLGYWLGISPLATAGLFAVGSSMAVEWGAERFGLRRDSAVSVVWAVGMAAGVFFVFLTPGYVPEPNTFLFGNILTVGDADIVAISIYAAVLALFTAAFYRKIVAVAFDADFAAVTGLPARAISYAMTVFVAVGIVLTIRLVGIMLLMSVLSLPMITAELFCRRYIGVMGASAAISLLAGTAGIMLSTLIEVPCSALIVLTMALIFVAARLLTIFVGRPAKKPEVDVPNTEIFH